MCGGCVHALTRGVLHVCTPACIHVCNYVLYMHLYERTYAYMCANTDMDARSRAQTRTLTRTHADAARKSAKECDIGGAEYR